MSVFDATFNFVGGGKWSIIEATDLQWVIDKLFT